MLVRGLAHWVPEDGERVEEQTVGGLLRWAAAEAPGVVALVEGLPDPSHRRRWTYAQLKHVLREQLSRDRPRP